MPAADPESTATLAAAGLAAAAAEAKVRANPGARRGPRGVACGNAASAAGAAAPVLLEIQCMELQDVVLCWRVAAVPVMAQPKPVPEVLVLALAPLRQRSQQVACVDQRVV